MEISRRRASQRQSFPTCADLQISSAGRGRSLAYSAKGTFQARRDHLMEGASLARTGEVAIFLSEKREIPSAEQNTRQAGGVVTLTRLLLRGYAARKGWKRIRLSSRDRVLIYLRRREAHEESQSLASDCLHGGSGVLKCVGLTGRLPEGRLNSASGAP